MQPLQLIKIGEVIRRTGVSRARVYQLVKTGAFPRQVTLGPRSVAWAAHEIDDWIQGRLAARN
ncbi:helix-turn-helix transcriptional regulator [Aeromonas caviae]|uniref:helix-turn-helix transcriptional regulator n=1 Tax=Aeromonas caviae TaxID=648 RepID=UPI003CF5ABE4